MLSLVGKRDPVLVVGLDKLGYAVYEGLLQSGWVNVGIWIPDRRAMEGRSIIRHFKRTMSSVWWQADGVPEGAWAATVVTCVVAGEVRWPERFGQVLSVEDVLREEWDNHLFNDARRIWGGEVNDVKDKGFRARIGGVRLSL